MGWELAVTAAALLGFSVVSRRLDGTPITSAIVFIGVGIVAGSSAFDLFDAASTAELVKRLAEATLVLVLFSDASRIDLRALRREYTVPARLLGIGLPLTIVLGTLVAVVLFGAISFPAVRLVFEQIGWGICGGAIGGAVTAAAVVVGTRRGLIEPSWLQVVPAAGAALAYGLATPLGGSGFIAAFVAGMVFGGLRQSEGGPVTDLTDELGEVLNAATLLVFGAVLHGGVRDRRALGARPRSHRRAAHTTVRVLVRGASARPQTGDGERSRCRPTLAPPG